MHHGFAGAVDFDVGFLHVLKVPFIHRVRNDMMDTSFGRVTQLCVKRHSGGPPVEA